MKKCSVFIAITIMLIMALPVLAAEKTQPVRMGCGLMTFDTVPGWGLRPNGESALGPTHGAVVIDKAGNIYTSAKKGVVVFSPDGKVVQEYLGDKYSNIHDKRVSDVVPAWQVQTLAPRNVSIQCSATVDLELVETNKYGTKGRL